MNAEEMEVMFEAIERVVLATGSMADKVIRLNPRWDELQSVLTEDELRVFVGILAWAKRHPPTDFGEQWHARGTPLPKSIRQAALGR